MRRLYEWKVMNSQSATSQTTDKIYKNRFTKIIDYAKAHKSSTAVRTEVKRITNNSFHYTEHHNSKGSEWDVDIVVVTSKFDYNWTLQYYVDGKYESGEVGTGYEDLLRALAFYINTPNHGTPEYNNLLVESKSTIEDFRAYENLWD